MELIGEDAVKTNDEQVWSDVSAAFKLLKERVDSETLISALPIDTILESDVHPLITPDFIGTDEEKITVLNYWAELIGLLRTLDITVISHENKQAIVNRLKAELDFINAELNNTTAALVANDDGTHDLRKTEVDPAQTETKPREETVVDLNAKEEEAPKAQWQIDLKKAAASKQLTRESLKKMAGIK